MKCGCLELMLHDEQMPRGILGGIFSSRGAMLVIKWLFFWFR